MTDVLHVITGLGVGGAETMLVQLTAALQARGLTQHVVGLSALDARARDIESAGVEVTILGARSAAVFPLAMPKLLRTVRALRPRILQGWMYHGNLAASLCHRLAGNRGERTLMWNLRASNMDDARYGRLIRVSALVSRSVEVAIANSQAGIDFHRARGFRPKRFVLIDNGVDVARFRPDPGLRRQVRGELGIGESEIVAIHAARVDPMKDHATLLAAMAQLPSLTAILAGSGTQALDTPKNVRALGPRGDLERLYAAADIVVSSSAFGEGFANVIAEGMSSALMPVATDVGDARRIIGDTGTIVAPRDVQGLAAALRELAALSDVERRRRGQAARRRIAANFALERSVDAYAQLYAAA